MSLIPLLFACLSAPVQDESTDEVSDQGQAYAAAKDAALAQLSWDEVDEEMEALVPASAEGCGVSIVEGNALTYVQGYGSAGSGGDWTHGTVAPVGSISKTFTAVAIMALVEDNQLDLSDRVSEHLPDLGSDDFMDARVWELLAHLSGIGGSTTADAAEPTFVDPAAATVLREPALAYLDYAASTAAAGGTGDALPGDGDTYNGAVYSNAGYSVLGAIIDEVTSGYPSGQRGYEQYVWSLLSDAVGDHDSTHAATSPALVHSWRHSNGDIPQLTDGFEADGMTTSQVWDNVTTEGWEGPSGGWALTAGDMGRFIIGYSQDAVLSTASREEMETVRSSLLDGYGYGIINKDSSRIGHGGTIGGHSAWWSWNPSEEIGITIICNAAIQGSVEAAVIAIEQAIDGNIGIGELGDTAPAAPSSVALTEKDVPTDGAVWALDTSTFAVLSPRLLRAPFALDTDLAFQIEVGRAGLSASILSGSHSAEKGVFEAHKTLCTFSGAEGREHTAFSGCDALPLQWDGTEVEVDEVVVNTGLRSDGELVQAITGALDLRDMLTDSEAEDLCRQIAAEGEACGQCDDGTAACADVEIRSFDAGVLATLQ